MSNLTLSVEEQVVEQARAAARQQGTSLNALIRQFIERLAGRPRGETVAAELENLWRTSAGRSDSTKFRREDVYAERTKRKRRG